jgi:hypothetical protein
MKHFLVAFLVFVSTMGWAAPAGPDFNINVHVTGSHMVVEGDSLAHRQVLSATVDGKKYELKSLTYPNALLAPGDYKARVARDDHRHPYDSWKEYELQFPDGRTRVFVVVGQFE